MPTGQLNYKRINNSKTRHPVQLKIVKPIICAPPSVSGVPPTLPLKWFQCSTDDSPLLSLQGRSSSASSFHASPPGDRWCDVLSFVPAGILKLLSQHFRSSEKQATCEGCLAPQSICSVVSLHSGMSRAVHPQEFTKVDVDHQHISIWAPNSTLTNSLNL